MRFPNSAFCPCVSTMFGLDQSSLTNNHLIAKHFTALFFFAFFFWLAFCFCLQKAATVSPYHPEDDEEIFPPKTKPMRDYSREPLSGGSGKLKVRMVPAESLWLWQWQRRSGSMSFFLFWLFSKFSVFQFCYLVLIDNKA